MGPISGGVRILVQGQDQDKILKSKLVQFFLINIRIINYTKYFINIKRYNVNISYNYFCACFNYFCKPIFRVSMINQVDYSYISQTSKNK